MKLPHYRKYLEHCLRRTWILPPVVPPEGSLRDLLARTEAVVYCTAAKAVLSEILVNSAAEIRL
ncbi:hypothetical protein J15TS10_27220 [Paenibacillus woosongensis]|uniref:Uncharacterized protein n=1 Tax=Paenibacillus woosongensis TaxID=307580 RepID=A0ABQ4MSD4_9BACL|nr:hypothetical protein J15TS10_27220 [Paenibacillus woosongensis]